MLSKDNLLIRNAYKLAESADDVTSARLCTFINPYSYWMLRSKPDVLEDFDVIGVDGVSLCLMLNRLGVKNVKRFSFDMTSIARIVFEKAEQAGESVFLVGAPKKEIEKAVGVISARYGGLKICGFHHGFIDAENQNQLFEKIRAASADIVICGMGVINQECFLAGLFNSGWSGQGYSCGGFFHQIAKGDIEYYPGWIDRWNMRWLFRIIDEPKLVIRYLIQYPIAFFALGRDALSFRFAPGVRGE